MKKRFKKDKNSFNILEGDERYILDEYEEDFDLSTIFKMKKRRGFSDESEY